MSEQNNTLQLTMPSQPPYSYGIGLQGELIIGFVAAHLPNGSEVRTHLVLPQEELEKLRHFLNQTTDIQKTLAATPPTSTQQ